MAESLRSNGGRRQARRARALSRAARPSHFAEPLEARTLLAVTPAGSEFHANTTTALTQAFAATAMDDDGDFVVAWQSYGSGSNPPDPNNGIYAKVYTRAGVAGSEINVNATKPGNQTRPAVAMDADGDFVVVWESRDSLVDNSLGVFAQRFNAAGVKQGGEIAVNTETDNIQRYPSVAMDADGDFVVVWHSISQDAGSTYGIYGQRFNAAGGRQGVEFPVNTMKLGNQWYPTTAMDASGDFVVAWHGDGQDPDGSRGIYAQRYNAAGATQGNEFRVNTFTSGVQSFAAAAMDDDGDFVIAWTSNANGQGDSADGVFAQPFDPAGVPKGGEVHANAFVAGQQRDAAVAMDADGDFVVTWQSYYQDPPPPALGTTGIYAQRFNAGGIPRETEFRANATIEDDQMFPAAAMDADGDFVLAWASEGQDPGDLLFQFGIYGQRYTVTPGLELTGADFLYQSSPHRLKFTFNQNVGASLGAADLTVQKLGTGGGPVAVLAPTYDGTSNAGTFAFNRPILADGNYRATLAAAGVRNASNVPISADYVMNFFVLAGDANRDRTVGFADLVTLAQNYGTTGKTFSQRNFNYDAPGVVGFDDLVIIAQQYNKSLAPAAAEPVASAAAIFEQVLADRRGPPDRIFNATEPVRRPKPRRQI